MTKSEGQDLDVNAEERGEHKPTMQEADEKDDGGKDEVRKSQFGCGYRCRGFSLLCEDDHNASRTEKLRERERKRRGEEGGASREKERNSSNQGKGRNLENNDE